MLKVAVWGEAPRMLKVTKLNFVLPSDYGVAELILRVHGSVAIVSESFVSARCAG